VVRPASRLENLAARVSLMLYQLSWRTPLHKMRITGKLPTETAGRARRSACPVMRRAGRPSGSANSAFMGMEQSIDAIDYDKLSLPPAFADYIHRFDWLRDLWRRSIVARARRWRHRLPTNG
jgi:hypothetical protein